MRCGQRLTCRQNLRHNQEASQCLAQIYCDQNIFRSKERAHTHRILEGDERCMSWEQGLTQLPMRNRRRQKHNPHIKRRSPPRSRPISTIIHFLHIHRESKRLLRVKARQAQMFHLESV